LEDSCAGAPRIAEVVVAKDRLHEGGTIRVHWTDPQAVRAPDGGDQSVRIRYVNFSPDEFLVGVAGMTFKEIGAHWLVWSLIYSNGDPVASRDPRPEAVPRCHGTELRTLLDHLAEIGKLVISDGNLAVKRCAKNLMRVGCSRNFHPA
jgi:hypothetical protein